VNLAGLALARDEAGIGKGYSGTREGWALLPQGMGLAPARGH